MMKNKAKRWVCGVLFLLVALITSNYAIWKAATEDILTFEPWYNGGLDRMGYIIGSKHYRKHESTLPKRHIDGVEYNGQKIDVITIGDSFSNIQMNGRDPMYQDWIASLYDLNVLNLQPYLQNDKISSLLILANSGFLDKIRPRIVILQSVERYCVTEHARTYNPNMNASLEAVERYYRNTAYISNPPKISFINTGNFKFLLFSLLYRLSDNAFISKVCVRDLDRPFFSVKNSKRLLFIREDVTFLSAVTHDTIRKLNDNLNMLADVLRKKDISLVFLPAPDKYNVYSDYIVRNPYPKSMFFELMRAVEPKRYLFVDTKSLLLEEVRKGEADVYYADDTHWSWKAVKKIAEHLNYQKRSNAFEPV